MVFHRLIFAAHARLLLPSPGGETPQRVRGSSEEGDSFGLTTTAGERSIHKSQQTKAATMFSWKVQGYWETVISHLQMAQECDANRWDKTAEAEAVSRLKQNARCLNMHKWCDNLFWSATEMLAKSFSAKSQSSKAKTDDQSCLPWLHNRPWLALTQLY